MGRLETDLKDCQSQADQLSNHLSEAYKRAEAAEAKCEEVRSRQQSAVL